MQSNNIDESGNNIDDSSNFMQRNPVGGAPGGMKNINAMGRSPMIGGNANGIDITSTPQ